MRFNETLELIQYKPTPDEMGGQSLAPIVVKTVRGTLTSQHATEKLLAATTVHREERFVFQTKDRSVSRIPIDAVRTSEGVLYTVLKQNEHKHTISYLGERRKPRDKR